MVLGNINIKYPKTVMWEKKNKCFLNYFKGYIGLFSPFYSVDQNKKSRGTFWLQKSIW